VYREQGVVPVPETRVNGVSIFYDVLGDGAPVAFLNGVMMTTRSWVLQTSVVRRRYRCVMHDFRGQLLSEKPRRQWRLDEHADDLSALLDELGIDRCHLVGTSYGGEVGMLFAVRSPGRVASLTVISSVSEVDEQLDDAVSLWAETALSAPQSLYRVSFPFNFSESFIADNPDLLEQGEARLAACPPDFFPAFARLVEAFRSLDLTGDLHRIECPTLVMVGELDRLKPPRFSRLIAERIPGAEFLMIPGAGHAVVIERPAEVNTAILGFLRRFA
jgi:3-oxoadipate enol-lactonase